MTQLVNKAASGDLKAVKVLMQMTSRFPELVSDPKQSIGSADGNNLCIFLDQQA